MPRPRRGERGRRNGARPLQQSGGRTGTDDERAELVAVLRRSIVLGALPPAGAAELAARCRIVALRTGEVLWRAGAPARAVGLVLRGNLKLVRPDAAQESIVGIAGPADVLGEVGFTLGRTYHTDAVAVRTSRVALLSSAALRTHLERAPQLAAALALDLARQVVRLQRQVVALSGASVEVRLARVLVELADRSGESFLHGVLVPLRLRRADLAAMAGTTLESASRKMTEWARKGWVVSQPAGFWIRDLGRLRTRCGL